jgi:nitroreductase
MDILTALLDRRSIRKYLSKDVPEEIIMSLLKAAMYAPSARNTQSWQFIVVRKREMLDAIMEVHPYSQMLDKAPLAIIVCGDKTLEEHEGYLALNCSAATQNLMLAAYGCGLGTVWLGVYPRKERIEPLCELFNLPAHIVPISIVVAGYPDETRVRPERFLKERIHFETW